MEAPSAAIVTGILALAGLGLAAVPLGPTADAGAAATTHHVHVADFDMDPDPLQIDAGDTVTWHNHDSVSHTATEGDPDDGGAPEWDTATIAAGGSASITFDEAASYAYYCAFHPSTMNGFGLDVVRPPTVAIDAPAEGEEVSGTVEVAGSASDPDGAVQRVDVRIDGGPWREAQGTTSWTFSWDTTDVDEGGHTVEARSYDGEAFGDLASVNVTVDNPQPDLEARDLRVEDRAPGREATLAVTVENGGDAPAPETPVLFTYEVRGEERTAGTATAPPPETGDADDVTVVWDTRGQVGEFPIRAQVDPDDALVEEAEGNNAAESTACFPGADAACQAPGADPVGTVGG
jgi:plastocyanin